MNLAANELDEIIKYQDKSDQPFLCTGDFSTFKDLSGDESAL